MAKKVFKRHLKRGFEILFRQGPKAFINKVRVKMAEKKAVYIVDRDEKSIEYKDIEQITFEDTGESLPILAVQLHLYYEDLLEEFAAFFQNIPCKFDLYVSVRDRREGGEKFAQRIKKGFASSNKNLREIHVRPTQNRGRDIAPMYVLFAKELKKYKYVCHVHSKKSLYQEKEQVGWRVYSVGSLMGSTQQATRVLSFLEKNDDVGLIYPQRYTEVPVEAYGWMSNEKAGKKYMDSIGVPMKGGIFLYPAGSFFIVRNSAIKQMWDRKLTYEDFDEENAQTDGTLAHALERALAQVVEYNGYHQAIIDDTHQKISIDNDKNTFADVFKNDREKLLMDLSGYDVISFDIFDTLLTRCFYHPVDVFSYMSTLVEEKDLGIKADDFVSERLAAENIAIEKYKSSANIDHIYEVLKDNTGISEASAKVIKQLELETEEKALIARREVLAIYNAVKDNGKEIIITSDMYLKKDFVEKVLKKNGIDGYNRLYISCDEGKRKDDKSLWEQVLSDYSGKNLAHIGDNITSDWQVLSDALEHGIWILNPRDEESIVPISAVEKKDSKLESGLLKGLSINGGIYNSPFALSPNGNATFEDSYTLGFSVFGPLMYEYMVWLHENTPENATLAFLAREGYVFKQIYEAIYKDKAKDHLYFLASRRAVSVASIRTEEDILEICRRDYDGDLSNLLESRLGVPRSESKKFKDKYVHFKEGMPDDQYEDTMKQIRGCFEGIIERAKKEREAYLNYYHGCLEEEKRASTVFVDVGYAGTIQYYLYKLFNTPVTGAYMAVFDEHKGLSENNLKTLAMYRRGRDKFAKVIENTQLFLESVLQAPYGQLLYFDGENPVYKDEAKRPVEIEKLQKGMLDYAKLRASFSPSKKSGKADIKYMQRIYKGLIFGRYIDKKVAGIFTVEDSYSQDTTLHYDYTKGKWSI